MSLDYWYPRKSEKAKGYFIRREHHDKIIYGDAFFKRLEDAQKACDKLNEMIDNGEKRRKENWKENHHDKFRKPKTN